MPLFQAPAITQVKVVSITRVITAASGSVPFTGLGFKPRSVFMFGGLGSGGGVGGIGISDGSAQGNYLFDVGGGLIYVQGNLAAAGPVNITAYQVVTGITMDDDGFTLAWLKIGTPTGADATVYLLCLG